MSVAPESVPAQGVPSPTMTALLPLENPYGTWRLRKLTDGELAPMLAAIRSGQWPFDPTETDPRTGLDAVQTAVRLGQMWTDQDILAVVKTAVARGAPIDREAPDGKRAWLWTMEQQQWDLAHGLEKLGAARTTARSARQEEALSHLNRWKESSLFGRALVQIIVDPDGFGSLDAKIDGVPLALKPVFNRMQVNGVDVFGVGTGSDTKHVDQGLKNLRDLGTAALAHDPRSDLPIWCWLIMGQMRKSAEQLQAHVPTWQQVSATRRKEWDAAWATLAKNIERARAPKVRAGPERTRTFMEAVVDLLERTASDFQDPSVSDKTAQRLQPLVAFGLGSLRYWKKHVAAHDKPEAPVAPEIERAIWQGAARLSRAVAPQRFEQPNFCANWNSGMYYALQPGVYADTKKVPTVGLPDVVVEPWLTLPPVFHSVPDDDRERMNALAVEWLTAHPPADARARQQPELLLAGAPNSALLHRLQEHHLDATLPEPSARSLRPRM